MSELHDQLVATIQSEAFASAVHRLDEAQANQLGAIVMSVVNEKPIQQPQMPAPPILSEQEFLKLSPEQLRRLEEYDSYVESKMAKFSEAQQAAIQGAEMAAASQRLQEMRQEQRDAFRKRQQQRDRLIERLVTKAGTAV